MGSTASTATSSRSQTQPWPLHPIKKGGPSPPRRSGKPILRARGRPPWRGGEALEPRSLVLSQSDCRAKRPPGTRAEVVNIRRGTGVMRPSSGFPSPPSPFHGPVQHTCVRSRALHPRLGFGLGLLRFHVAGKRHRRAERWEGLGGAIGEPRDRSSAHGGGDWSRTGREAAGASLAFGPLLPPHLRHPGLRDGGATPTTGHRTGNVSPTPSMTSGSSVVWRSWAPGRYRWTLLVERPQRRQM